MGLHLLGVALAWFGVDGSFSVLGIGVVGSPSWLGAGLASLGPPLGLEVSSVLLSPLLLTHSRSNCWSTASPVLLLGCCGLLGVLLGCVTISCSDTACAYAG